MKRTFFLLLLTLSTLSLPAGTRGRTSGPVAQDKPDSLIVVSGVVMNAEDRTLLPDANVRILGINRSGSEGTTTDKKGKFELRVTPVDTLEIKLSGYLTYTCKATPNMIIKLKPDPETLKTSSGHAVKQNKKDSRNVIKGVVLNAEDGKPVLGAYVYVQGIDSEKRVEGVDQAMTFLSGEFELRVAPGSVLVTECLGFLPDTSKVAPNMVVMLKENPAIYEDSSHLHYGY